VLVAVLLVFEMLICGTLFRAFGYSVEIKTKCDFGGVLSTRASQEK
jgi:hypothetical protein